jgi:hypothetical protein
VVDDRLEDLCQSWAGGISPKGWLTEGGGIRLDEVQPQELDGRRGRGTSVLACLDTITGRIDIRLLP